MARLRLALMTCGLVLTSAPATANDPPPIPPAARQKLAALPPECQKAYEAMRACLEKTIAAGAPESLRPQWEKQLDDTLTSWQALKGMGVQQVCRDIAAKPNCED